MLRALLIILGFASLSKAFIHFPPASCIGRRDISSCDESSMGLLMGVIST